MVMQQSEAVFYHNDSTIDNHADSDGKSAETHQVCRDTVMAHQQKGDQQRERQREDDDKCRTQFKEEQKEDDRDQYRSSQQGGCHRVDRFVGDLGTVIDRFDLYSFGKGCIDKGQLLFDGGDHLGGIGTAALQHHPKHRLFAIDRHGTETRRFSLFDLCDIGDGDSKGIFAAHYGIAYIIQCVIKACPPDKILLFVKLQILSSCGDVGLLESINYLIVGGICRLKPFGVDQYIVLFLETSPSYHLFDTVYRFEQRCYDILLQLSELCGAVLSGCIFDLIPKNLSQTCGVGSHRRFAPSFGDLDTV